MWWDNTEIKANLPNDFCLVAMQSKCGDKSHTYSSEDGGALARHKRTLCRVLIMQEVNTNKDTGSPRGQVSIAEKRRYTNTHLEVQENKLDFQSVRGRVLIQLLICLYLLTTHDTPLVEYSLPHYRHIGFLWFNKRQHDGEWQAYRTRSSSHQLLHIALYSFSVCRNPSSTHPSEMISDRFRV